jgi:hypothetical protein
MPFISGQAPGLIAGIIMVVVYTGIYLVKRYAAGMYMRAFDDTYDHKKYRDRYSAEMSEELTDKKDKAKPETKDKDCGCKDKSDKQL